METLQPLALEAPAHGVVFVPVRHHSPACAAALAKLLAEIKPQQVLIEAPQDFEALLPILLDPDTKPPVAIVAVEAAVPGARRTTEEAEPVDGAAGGALPRQRAISYFPFCDYSPEYVAITRARDLGSRTAFIDLPSGLRFGIADTGEPHAPAFVPAFTDERLISHSAFVAELCRSIGLRDYNELWDHLFEQQLGCHDWRSFFRDIGAYCAAVRASVPAAEMALDGTLVREAFMVGCLREALARPERPIVVVTGGMHTPALIKALADGVMANSPAPAVQGKRRKVSVAGVDAVVRRAPISTRAYVIRYGFRELDRLNGYAAGMPSPAYYQRVWDASIASSAPPWRDVAADVLTAFSAHLAAERRVPAPPLPALANALEQAVRLADLRGHVGPTRQDLLDACTSAFLKDEKTVGSAPILDELTRFLTGEQIGDVPPSAGSPPLVEAVRDQARRLGFDLSFASRRKRELDIYRNDRHLAASRFLHALSFLKAGFGNRLSGPDVLSGQSRDILIETWTAAWSPMVEARLIELSVHGDDLATVAAAEIVAQARLLEEQGQGRNAVAGVRLLLTTCLIGLQPRLGFVTALVGREIEADPDLASVVKAMSELFLLWRSRAVLGLTGSPEVEGLIAGAYRRALYLLADIANASEERLPQLLGGLATLREVVASAGAGADEETIAVIDTERFSETIITLVDVPMAPALSGALAALAYLAGHRDAEFLIGRVRGGLAGAYLDPAEKIAALNGVIAITRELLWRVPGLIDDIDETIASMDDARFLECLPHLRLGFSALNPRETDEIATRIAGRRGVGPHALSTDVVYDIAEAEVTANLQLSLALQEQVTADGLANWLTPQPTPRLRAGRHE